MNSYQGTTNGNEDYGIRYKTSDGFVFDSYNKAVEHNIKESNRTNAGTYIEPYYG